MSKNFWEDESNEDFRDSPVEMVDGSWREVEPAAAPRQQVQPQRPVPPATKPAPAVAQEEESEQEFLEDTEEEDFSLVLSDANLRLEQGNLYKMIMNHNLFDGMDADPRAVRNVEREIKAFVRERMEIMLGMRQEKAEHYKAISQFNDLEVSVLKMLASTASKGKTESAEANQSVSREPKRQTLNTISGSTQQKLQKPVAPKPVPAKVTQKLPPKATAPLQRAKTASVDAILEEEGIAREHIEEGYIPLTKPVHELSPEELADRNKQAAERRAKHQTVKNPSALPMATYDQQEMIAMQRASDFSQSAGPLSGILSKLNKMGPRT